MSSAKQVTVRQARVGDAPALFELHLQALRAHPEAFAAEPQQTEAGRARWIGRLKRNLIGKTGTICLAETEPHVVGMSGIYRRTLAKMQHVATIWGLYVIPEWRGKGLAGRLVQANLEWAARHEVRIVRLAVVANNASALHCYLNHGFTVYGVEPQALRYQDRYYDELLMARRV